MAAAVFLAKSGKTKEEIRQYIEEKYYRLDFTLDSIRPAYKFDGSCQGSVPQAIAAFLESENFEDAIRNVISIGGDCDTTGAITGSIAWTYYIVQNGGWESWVSDRIDPAMQDIREQAMEYLPGGIYGYRGSVSQSLRPEDRSLGENRSVRFHFKPGGKKIHWNETDF